MRRRGPREGRGVDVEEEAAGAADLEVDCAADAASGWDACLDESAQGDSSTSMAAAGGEESGGRAGLMVEEALLRAASEEVVEMELVRVRRQAAPPSEAAQWLAEQPLEPPLQRPAEAGGPILAPPPAPPP
ncbi:hypothetical protein G7Z17_g13533 [Cylindrodendrum hubeiense]|uniref:Uncharacterized protein n=1 Tax=Cylindrodendrum hubeiense TaxID=595255 RepID=A0A9P5GTI6_9HYPO|nr:hypothetical protein G7Z17_g13533 [Cylindrodendrum hubeiense]